MQKFSQFVIGHKKSVVLIFTALALVGLVFTFFTHVNYNMADYLPKDAGSTAAISVIDEEFGEDVPNARVMLSDVSVSEAVFYKDEIALISGVKSATWLDDIVGADVLKTTPIDFLDPSVTENYYKGGRALISVSIESGRESSALKEIYSLIGEENAVSGSSVNLAGMQDMAVSEVLNAIVILLPIILIVLILSTTSWVEPLLFLAAIGAAIAVNMGTGALFKDISFITRTVSPILQLAVSLDYAIFLLHSFGEYRKSHEPKEAMRLAMIRSFPTVAASAATTVIGFTALIFMRFGIGSDLGIHLAKGVLLSFLSVMVFLPALTLLSYGLIDKTKHKSFLPSFKGAGRWLVKTRIPFMLLAILVAVPCFLAQSGTGFIYGADTAAQGTRAKSDEISIAENFGKENPLVLLVPKKSPGGEAALCEELSGISNVSSVVSYVTAVGGEIPEGMVSNEVLKQFYSENYARIIIYTDNPEEGEQSFKTVSAVVESAGRFYDSYYLAGQSASLFDMKATVERDTGIVNLIAAIGIFLVILFTFRSLVIPAVIVFSIETAIWINLSFAYFTGSKLNFIGYLVISTVQLGATVDYAILLTNRYLDERKGLPKARAMVKTLADNLAAILVSAVILGSAGVALALAAANPIVSELGVLLARGTALSFAMVVLVLPALLILFDGLIQKNYFEKILHRVSGRFFTKRGV